MTGNEAVNNGSRSGREVFLTWAPPLLVLLLILVLSLTPGSLYPEHPEIYNVAVHFLQFLFLGFFLARAMVQSRRGSSLGLTMSAICLCAVIALSTEVLQFTVPQRMFDVRDMLIDILGAFTGTFLYINFRISKRDVSQDEGGLSRTEDV